MPWTSYKQTWVGVAKVNSNVSGPLTKLTAQAIFGKNPLKIFSRTKKHGTLKLGIKYLELEASQVCTDDELMLTLVEGSIMCWREDLWKIVL